MTKKPKPKLTSQKSTATKFALSSNNSQPQNLFTQEEKSKWKAKDFEVQKPNKFVNNIMTWVCCLLIALGFNDIIFGRKFPEGTFSILAGVLLMPGVMNWDFRTANIFQKTLLICIAAVNISLIIYFVLRGFRIV
jgi:hypothetical protein